MIYVFFNETTYPPNLSVSDMASVELASINQKNKKDFSNSEGADP